MIDNHLTRFVLEFAIWINSLWWNHGNCHRCDSVRCLRTCGQQHGFFSRIILFTISPFAIFCYAYLLILYTWLWSRIHDFSRALQFADLSRCFLSNQQIPSAVVPLVNSSTFIRICTYKFFHSSSFFPFFFPSSVFFLLF